MQPSAKRRTDQRISTVEQQTDGHQHHAQGRELCEYRPGVWVDELWQQHRAEQQRLGVEQVRQQTALDRLRPVRFPGGLMGAIEVRQQGRAQALNTDPQQVRGAGQTHHVEGPGRRLEQRRQTQCRQRHMAGSGDGQAHRRGQRRAFALASTGLQQQDHVGAGQ